jgi:hypothetical protein
MAGEVEYVDRAIPDRLAVVRLMHWHGLDKRSLAAVLGFHGLLKLIDRNFAHGSRL